MVIKINPVLYCKPGFVFSVFGCMVNGTLILRRNYDEKVYECNKMCHGRFDIFD
jgi:hypothetical protein